MLIFDATNRSLKLLLGGAGVLPWMSSWQQSSSGTPYVPATATGVTAGATPVTVVAAPAASFYRQLKHLLVANTSGGAVSLTVRYSDGASDRDIATFALDNGDVLQYADGEGFRVFTAAGELKVTSGGTGGGPHAASHQDGGADYLGRSAVSPGSLGADQNDWAPGTGDVIRVTSSVAVNITGIGGPAAGDQHRIVNIGANTVTLKHQDAGSAAANRFIGIGGADYVLYADDQVGIWYDGASSRWRISLA